MKGLVILVPSTRKIINKAGQEFYEIRVSRGRDSAPLSTH